MKKKIQKMNWKFLILCLIQFSLSFASEHVETLSSATLTGNLIADRNAFIQEIVAEESSKIKNSTLAEDTTVVEQIAISESTTKIPVSSREEASESTTLNDFNAVEYTTVRNSVVEATTIAEELITDSSTTNKESLLPEDTTVKNVIEESNKVLEKIVDKSNEHNNSVLPEFRTVKDTVAASIAAGSETVVESNSLNNALDLNNVVTKVDFLRNENTPMELITSKDKVLQESNTSIEDNINSKYASLKGITLEKSTLETSITKETTTSEATTASQENLLSLSTNYHHNSVEETMTLEHNAQAKPIPVDTIIESSSIHEKMLAISTESQKLEEETISQIDNSRAKPIPDDVEPSNSNDKTLATLTITRNEEPKSHKDVIVLKSTSIDNYTSEQSNALHNKSEAENNESLNSFKDNEVLDYNSLLDKKIEEYHEISEASKKEEELQSEKTTLPHISSSNIEDSSTTRIPTETGCSTLSLEEYTLKEMNTILNHILEISQQFVVKVLQSPSLNSINQLDFFKRYAEHLFDLLNPNRRNDNNMLDYDEEYIEVKVDPYNEILKKITFLKGRSTKQLPKHLPNEWLKDYRSNKDELVIWLDKIAEEELNKKFSCYFQKALYKQEEESETDRVRRLYFNEALDDIPRAREIHQKVAIMMDLLKIITNRKQISFMDLYMQ